MFNKLIREIIIYFMLGLLIVILFVILPMYLMYYFDTKFQLETKKQEQESVVDRDINICINNGGVPIRSLLDGRLKDCKFK